MGSTLKGKNLLQEEQILFFKSGPPAEKGGKNCRVASPVSIPIHLLDIIHVLGAIVLLCNSPLKLIFHQRSE